MDFMANKAIMIAVSIFITLAIASGVLMIINNIQLIYGQVYETDTSITNQFSEFDKFDNSDLLGIDIENAIRKYQGNKLVIINGPKEIEEKDYSTIYHTTLEEKDGIYTINVKKK